MAGSGRRSAGRGMAPNEGLAVYQSWPNIAATLVVTLITGTVWAALLQFFMRRLGRAASGGGVTAGLFLSFALLALLGMALWYFVLESVSVIRQKAGHRPLIVIDARGVTDNSERYAVGLIPWEDINSMIFRRVPTHGLSRLLGSRDYYIGVTVRDPAPYIKRMSPRRQRLLGEGEEAPGEVSTLVPSTSPARNEEFFDSARRYCRDVLGIERIRWLDERFIGEKAPAGGRKRY